MGKVKYIRDIREFFKKSPIVDINSLKRFINRKDKSYINLLISNLVKRKEIKKITKGFYTIHEDPSLVVFCFNPSYLGIQNALSFHNLWEQETNPAVLTVRNVRTGLRKVFDRNVIIKRLPAEYFFGFDYYEDGDFYLPYSDIEKTFIDMVYFKEYIDKEVIKEFRKKIDKKKLKSYLRKYPIKFRKTALEIYNPKH
jgi:predicted transcriptional regulator of viral defense system